jgi:hypothetical protein
VTGIEFVAGCSLAVDDRPSESTSSSTTDFSDQMTVDEAPTGVNDDSMNGTSKRFSKVI